MNPSQVPSNWDDALWTSFFDALLNPPVEGSTYPCAELVAQFDNFLSEHPDRARALKVALSQQHLMMCDSTHTQ